MSSDLAPPFSTLDSHAMLPAFPDDRSLIGVLEWLVQWTMASPVEAALVIGVGVALGVVGLVLGLQVARWAVTACVRLCVWIGATTVAVVVDRRQRRREPSPSATRSRTDTETSTGTSRPALTVPEREYLRVRPSSAEYDVEALVTALAGLNATHQRTEASWSMRQPTEDVVEFLVATAGRDAGVEFYIGGSMPLDRLATALPYRQCGFDVERVSMHPAALLDPQVSSETASDSPDRAAAPPERDAPVAEPATDGGAVTAAGDTHVADDHGQDVEVDAPDPTDVLLGDLRAAGVEPVVYRLNTWGQRGNDWMMRLPGLTDLLATAPGGEPAAGPSTGHPLTPVIETLDELAVPAVYQVTARSFRSWANQADLREYELEHRRDTLGQKAAAFGEALLGGIDPAHVSHHPRDATDRRNRRRGRRPSDRGPTMARSDRRRRACLDRKNPDTTYVANVRLAAIPTGEHDRSEVANALRTLRADLDALEGEFYRLDAVPSRRHEHVTGLLGVRGPRHRQRLRRLCRRAVRTPMAGHTWFNKRRRWPDLVCTPDELAAWASVPSTSWLPPRLAEAVEHDPEHARPLQPVSPSIRDRYVGHDVDGRTLGYALTDDGGPDLDQPFRLPVDDLRTHEVRQGLPGCGKTTDMARDVLADHRETAGPTIVFTGPGGDLADLVMRGVAAEHGIDHLRERVHWFRVPAVQPGITFFDLRTVQGAADVTDWVHAAGDVADKYIRVARSLIGAEAFDRAPLAKDTLRAYIAAGFDPSCYPSDPDDDSLLMPHRETESAETYRLWQLEAQVAAVSELTQAASQREYQSVAGRLPDVADPRLARNLRRPFQFDQRTAANILGGVQTRLSAISNNTRLAELFDNTVEQFGFHRILEGGDADDIYVFDLGALTAVSQRAYALTLLSVLELQLKSHTDVLERVSGGDYLATLHIDEAAQLVDTPEFGAFLDVIRNYSLGVNVTVQNPEQVRERGGERTYRSLLEHTQTTVLGPGISDRQAGELCPADWEADAFHDHVRDFPESRRLVQLPPQADETRPQVFELHRGPLPEWHPDAAGGPFADASFRERFEGAKADVKRRTDETYGVPAGEAERAIREQRELGVPAVTDALGLARDNLAAFLALVTRHAQQAAAVDGAAAVGDESTAGSPDTNMDTAAPEAPGEELPIGGGDVTRDAALDADNGSEPSERRPWVPVSEVYSRFMTQIDVALADADADAAEAATAELPEATDIAECVDASPYFERALRDDVHGQSAVGDPGGASEEMDSRVVVRLTAQGQQVAMDLEEPGEAVTAGSDAHTAMLRTVQQALQRAGPIELRIVEQDGTDEHDAIGGLRRTVDGHQETVTLVVECERTTVAHPTKVLQNLAKAQAADAVVLFAVPADDSDDENPTSTARRLAGILLDPINRRRREPRYYVHERLLTFHGGAKNGGETVVRRRLNDDDSGRSPWIAHPDRTELRAPNGEVLAAFDDLADGFETAHLEALPAYFTHDPRTGQYTVHEHGAHHEYADRDALESDWVAVKEPFVPEYELPAPDYGLDSYAILVVNDGSGQHDAERAVSVYRDEGGGDKDGSRLQPLEALVEALEAGDLTPATADRDAQSDDERSISTLGRADTGLPGTERSPVERTDLDEEPPALAGLSLEGSTRGVAHFAAIELTHSPGSRVPFRPVYDQYEAFIADSDYEAISDQKFTAALQEYFAATMDEDEWEGDKPVASTAKWYSPWNRTVHCLVGVELEQSEILDEYAPASE